MFGWWKELLEIRWEFRERRARLHKESIQDDKVCASCETLKRQLEISNHEKGQLLERILEKPEPIVNARPVATTQPRHMPWSVRQQMLENEDRRKAQLMREAPKPDAPTDVAALERELGVEGNDALHGGNAQV